MSEHVDRCMNLQLIGHAAFRCASTTFEGRYVPEKWSTPRKLIIGHIYLGRGFHHGHIDVSLNEEVKPTSLRFFKGNYGRKELIFEWPKRPRDPFAPPATGRVLERAEGAKCLLAYFVAIGEIELEHSNLSATEVIELSGRIQENLDYWKEHPHLGPKLGVIFGRQRIDW